MPPPTVITPLLRHRRNNNLPRPTNPHTPPPARSTYSQHRGFCLHLRAALQPPTRPTLRATQQQIAQRLIRSA